MPLVEWLCLKPNSLNKCFIAYEKRYVCLEADAQRFWIMKIVMKWDDKLPIRSLCLLLKTGTPFATFNLFGKMPNLK